MVFRSDWLAIVLCVVAVKGRVLFKRDADRAVCLDDRGSATVTSRVESLWKIICEV